VREDAEAQTKAGARRKGEEEDKKAAAVRERFSEAAVRKEE
jgi:hypothetical protein